VRLGSVVTCSLISWGNPLHCLVAYSMYLLEQASVFTSPYHPVCCPSKTMWNVKAGNLPDEAKQWLLSKAPVVPKPIATPPTDAKPVVKKEAPATKPPGIKKLSKATTAVKKEGTIKEAVKKESSPKSTAKEAAKESTAKEAAKKGSSQASHLVTYLANNMVDNRWGI